MFARAHSRHICGAFAPLRCTASGTVLLFFMACGGAAIDMKDCPVVHNITCKSGTALLNVTAESCGNDCPFRLVDVDETVRVFVYPGETVTVPCSSPLYYLSVDVEAKNKLACYNLTNETSSTHVRASVRATQGRRDDNFNMTTPTEDPRPPNQPFNLSWLFLIVPLSILVLIGVAVYLWKRLTS